MSETKRISEQLQSSFYKGAWHGPSVMEALDGVSAKQAATRSIPNAHTIWELVLHTTTWIREVNKMIAEMSYVQVPEDINFPNVTDESEASWNKAVESLKRTYQKFEKHVATLKDPALEKIPDNTSSTFYRLIHGVIQHNIYHAGQIVLLKKFK